jgi:hypothetical protein
VVEFRPASEYISLGWGKEGTGIDNIPAVIEIFSPELE